MPKLYFLGTGTSLGVPQIGCNCAVCRSADKRDRRLRTSALIESDVGERLLIDCGPDFRQQMLNIPFRKLEGVLLTHEHFDHVGGLDDLRPSSLFGCVNVYADATCVRHLSERIPYCFVENRYPGVPNIVLHTIQQGEVLHLAGMSVCPVSVQHGKLPILGYRIADLAYLTDMSAITESSMQLLKGIKVLVVNALRYKPHHSHQSVPEALELVASLSPERAYLIHMSHQVGLHAEVEKRLPANVHLAYDGLQIEW